MALRLPVPEFGEPDVERVLVAFAVAAAVLGGNELRNCKMGSRHTDDMHC